MTPKKTYYRFKNFNVREISFLNFFFKSMLSLEAWIKFFSILLMDGYFNFLIKIEF